MYGGLCACVWWLLVDVVGGLLLFLLCCLCGRPCGRDRAASKRNLSEPFVVVAGAPPQQLVQVGVDARTGAPLYAAVAVR